MLYRLPWLWLAFFITGMTHANTVVIDGLQRQMAIGSHVEELEDPTGRASITSVQQHADWKVSDAIEPNKGFTDSAWWFRVTLHITDPEDQLWYLMINDAILNQIDVYFVLPSDSTKHFAGGGWVPVSQRYVPYRTHIFQIPALRDSDIHVYIRVKSELAVVLPVSVLDSRQFMQHITHETWVYTLYLGFMAAMLFFNLVVYFRMRDQANLLYCFFAACMILIAVAFCGLGRQFFWTDAPRADNYVFSLAVAFAGITATLFTERFLFGTDTNVLAYQRQRRWFIMVIGFTSVAFTLGSNVFLGVQIGVVCCILSLANILINSFRAAFRGIPNAILLIVAWIGLITGAIIFSMRGFGLLPSNAFTTNIMQIASLFECFLLVVALVEKSRTMQHQMDRLNALTLEKLDKEVATRTAELHAAESRLKSQQKQRSLDVLSGSVTSTFLPSLQHIQSHLNHASSTNNALGEFLHELADGEEELTSDINKVLSRVSGTHTLILEGTERVETILRKLVMGHEVHITEGTLPWASAPSLVKGLLDRLGIEAALRIQIAEDAESAISPVSWKEVMLEVLRNACDALRENGSPISASTLQIHLSESSGIVECLVADSGAGMAPDTIDRVFDPFFTTRSVGSGSGLGLTKVREIMRMSGGSISLQTEKGAGTTVLMTWPVYKRTPS